MSNHVVVVFVVVLNGTFSHQEFQGFMLIAAPFNAIDETTSMGTFQVISLFTILIHATVITVASLYSATSSNVHQRRSRSDNMELDGIEWTMACGREAKRSAFSRLLSNFF